MRVRAAEVAGVAVLALAVTAAVAAPVLRASSDRIFGMEVVGRHHDPFTVMKRLAHPITDNPFGIYLQPFTDIPGALLVRLAGPVAGYNWLVLLTFPLSAVAAYLLARHLALPPVGAGLAAMAFAFSPFHLAQAAYHPHIAQTQWVPLYLLALWRSLDDSRPSAIVLLVLSVVAVVLSNYYGGFIVAVITPVALAAYWHFKSRAEPASSGHAALTLATLAGVVAMAIGYAWYAVRPVVADAAAFGFPRNDLIRYSARWWSYLVPPVEHPLLGGFARRLWVAADVNEGLLEQQVTLGCGLVALAVVALFAAARRPSRTHASDMLQLRHASLAAVPVLAAVALAAFLLSLGPPALLHSALPMFRSYARFGVMVQLMIGLLGAIGAESLWRSRSRGGRSVCLGLLMLVAAEYAVWPPAMSRDVLPTAGHRWAAGQSDRLNVLDCAPITPASESVEWLTGYRISMRPGWFGDCTEPHFIEKLSAEGYTHLLVQKNTLEGRWFEHRRRRDGLEVAAQFFDSDVFAVTAPAPPVYTSRMTAFYPREYNESWTWRWMGTDASWVVVNRIDRPIAAAVDLEMSAFNGARRLTVLLDGSEIQTLTVQERRTPSRIGPLALTPGSHLLTFRPADAPSRADGLVHNGDRRSLSFAMGTWTWSDPGGHE